MARPQRIGLPPDDALGQPFGNRGIAAGEYQDVRELGREEVQAVIGGGFRRRCPERPPAVVLDGLPRVVGERSARPAVHLALDCRRPQELRERQAIERVDERGVRWRHRRVLVRIEHVFEEPEGLRRVDGRFRQGTRVREQAVVAATAQPPAARPVAAEILIAGAQSEGFEEHEAPALPLVFRFGIRIDDVGGPKCVLETVPGLALCHPPGFQFPLEHEHAPMGQGVGHRQTGDARADDDDVVGIGVGDGRGTGEDPCRVEEQAMGLFEVVAREAGRRLDPGQGLGTAPERRQAEDGEVREKAATGTGRREWRHGQPPREWSAGRTPGTPGVNARASGARAWTDN